MVVWGGADAGSQLLGDGWRFDPTTEEWTMLGESGVPAARAHHSAVWTEWGLIVWGGQAEGEGESQTGGRWVP